MHCTALAFDSSAEQMLDSVVSFILNSIVGFNSNISPVMHPLEASNAPRRRFDCLQGCYPYIDIVSPCRACEC